jgi:hypothetical protein
MRAALATVLASDKTLEASDIAIAVYGLQPAENGITYITHAQHAAVRRAMVALVRNGQVRDMGLHRGNWRAYASPEVAERQDRKLRRLGFRGLGRPSRAIRPVPNPTVEAA